MCLSVYPVQFAGNVCECVFCASSRIVCVFESCAIGSMCVCILCLLWDVCVCACILCLLQDGRVFLCVYAVQSAGNVCDCVFCARSRIVCVFESCAI